MNLTSYSSSESSDEANDTNNDLNYLNLNNQHSKLNLVCPYKDIKCNYNKATKTPSPSNVNFWSDPFQEENWTDEASIWGVATDSFAQVYKPNTFKRKDFGVKGYISKKAKLNDVSQMHQSITPIKKNDKSAEPKLITHPFIRSKLQKVALNNLPTKQMASLRFSSKPINRIKWCTPNFSHLILSASTDGFVRVMDVFSKTCLSNINCHQKSVKDAAWSACGHSIASCGYDKLLFVTDVESGTQTFSSSHDNFLTCVKFHPSNSNLIVTGSFDAILGFDIRTPKAPIRKYKHKDRLGQILDICFLSDSEFLSSCDFVSRDTADRCIMVWDFQSTASISNEIFHEKYTCPRLSCHPFKREFIAQTQGNYIAQFSSDPPYKMNKHKQYNHHKVSGYGIGCEVNPGGNIIASGNADGQVVLYSYYTTNVMTRIGYPCVGDIALDVTWHPVLSATCAYSTWDGRVDVWE